MNGVEILSSEKVVAEYLFNWKAFWITFVAMWIIMLVISVIIYILDGRLGISFIPHMTIVCGLIGGIGFGLLFGGAICPTPSKYETEYKVTISDEVSMNEFVEKYEIIDLEGKIYTVRERD